MPHHLPTTLRKSTDAQWGRESRVRFSQQEQPEGALVFVHGFRGKALETWVDFPTLLAGRPEVAGYDLFFYGYDTRQQAPFSAINLLEFLKALADAPASAVVNPSLASGLILRRDGFRYRHLIIAAHSLGAVVSRLALLSAIDDDGNPLQWLDRVRLVLFAPAHSGAKVVQLVALLMGGVPGKGQIEAVARKIYKSINDVEEGSRTLEDLKDDTRQLLASAHANLAKCHKAWVVHGERDFVVSARRFLVDHPTVPLAGADHFEVCKPTATRVGGCPVRC